MNAPYPPLGFFAFIDKDEDQLKWTYVQSLPVVQYVSDLLIERSPDPQVIANEMAQTMLRMESGNEDQLQLTAACHSYGMALIKLGVAPFTAFVVHGGKVTTSFKIPAGSAHEAHDEFDRVCRALEAEEAA